MLVKKGTRELILIAQDSTSWGRDLNSKSSITFLLEELEKIDALEWIRVMYLYPNTIPSVYFDYMKNSTKLLNYVDIPLQHASQKILKLMGRGGSPDYLRKLINRIREQVEDLVIRSTFIVGHPGETEKDFEDLLNFIKEMKFNRVGAFTYSDEENTGSAGLPDKVPEKVKQERYNRLMEVQQEISFDLNQKMIGKKFRVLIDDFNSRGRYLMGRTYGDAPEIDNEVIIENILDPEKHLGRFVDVEIIDAQPYELFGKIIH